MADHSQSVDRITVSASTTPKIKDVARVAGVSTATVSRALSKPDSVAANTRQVVLDAARVTGYRINQAARNLRQQKSGAVVVLVPNLGNPFFSQILAGIESTLAKRGLSVLMVDTKQSELPSEYLHHSRADGIIALDGSLPGTLLAEIQSGIGTPPIVFACEWDPDDMFPSVRVNNRHGAALAIEHLVELGHRNIGYVGGPPANVLTGARLEGVQRALQANNCAVCEQWLFQGDFSLQSGAHVAAQWLAMDNRPTALFCANDEMALGVISHLHRSGVNVPRDLSIVGFDDIDVARFFLPPLTTIRQPRSKLGTESADLLMEKLEHGLISDSRSETVLPVEMVVRQSTARIAN